MTSTALEIQCAFEVGLVLSGQTEDGRPEWLGTKAAFKRFNELVLWVESVGSYPWINNF
jgi:hypothetical protein